MLYDVNKRTIATPQRKMALRITSAYCTVSNVAAMVIAGIPPIHLLAIERAEFERDKSNGIPIATAKRNARRRVTERWQTE